MSKNPLISIITINYNNISVTLDLLLSIRECIYTNLEVIVVDNGSDLDPTEMIMKNYPEVIAIRSSKNLGFAGGNNLGIRYANGEFIFFVNNDTLFEENVIVELIKPFYQDEKIGIISPKVIYYETPNIIQYAGATEINSLTGRNKIVGQGENDNNELFKSDFTYFAHGAAMIIRKCLVEKVGIFPEVFFLYYEELDYSYRTRKTGFKIYFNSKAVIYHRVSYSVGEDSPLKVYYMTRNRIMFMQRNFTGIRFIIFILFFILFTIPKNSFNYIISGRKDLLSSFYKAILWNLKTPRK
ncbi:MAG: glycosyltransferase family 2 protein, partial [Cyclobacteriaceae bacterium]|nr:glycosyltransferase family 2 protein [Cyclobacteriaceae bacterium]